MNSTPRANRYEEFAKRYYPGRVVIHECPRCGNLSWGMTATKEPNSFEVRNGDGYNYLSDCARCYDVSTRNPEVFDWVLNVLNKAFNDYNDWHTRNDHRE